MMIYLDNAATSYPKPPNTIPCLTDYLEKAAGNPGRSGHRLSIAASEEIYQTRAAVASFIGCDKMENIIFTQNATHALNTIIRARIQPGEHVLISDLEHNSVYRPIWRLARDGIISFDIFSHTGDICSNIENLIRPNTSMLICTHVSNVSGYEMPVSQIASICQKNKIYFIIDASQSVGHHPLDVKQLNCDALCAPGHKGLLGLQGSGFLYVRENEGLRDVFQGGSGAHSLSPDMPEYLPDRFEAGTLPTPAILTMGLGIKYILERDILQIEKHELKLSLLMHTHLSEIPSVKLYSKPNSGIVAFHIENKSSDHVAELLDRKGIYVRGGYHCAPLAHRSLQTLEHGIVRISIGAFNSMGEIEVATHHIRQIAKK